MPNLTSKARERRLAAIEKLHARAPVGPRVAEYGEHAPIVEYEEIERAVLRNIFA